MDSGLQIIHFVADSWHWILGSGYSVSSISDSGSWEESGRPSETRGDLELKVLKI